MFVFVYAFIGLLSFNSTSITDFIQLVFAFNYYFQFESSVFVCHGHNICVRSTLSRARNTVFEYRCQYFWIEHSAWGCKHFFGKLSSGLIENDTNSNHISVDLLLMHFVMSHQMHFHCVRDFHSTIPTAESKLRRLFVCQDLEKRTLKIVCRSNRLQLQFNLIHSVRANTHKSNIIGFGMFFFFWYDLDCICEWLDSCFPLTIHKYQPTAPMSDTGINHQEHVTSFSIVPTSARTELPNWTHTIDKII